MIALLQKAVVSVPLRSQTVSSPVQVSTTLSVSAVAVAKPHTVSPGSPGNNPGSPAVLHGVSSPNIKQVNEHLSEAFHQTSSRIVSQVTLIHRVKRKYELTDII